MPNVLVTLRQLLPSLRGSSRRIAEAIIADPQIVIGSTITELAERCATSPTSVARFCVRAGFDGYKDLRLAVASAHSRDEAARDLFRIDDAEINLDDDLQEVIAKVAFQEARAIEETARHLDLDAVDAVVAALRGAGRIVVYGAGSSGLTAYDLHLKVARVGLPAVSWADAHFALTAAALLEPADVAFAVTHSGTTREAHELLRLAHERGATAIAITNAPGSPVAEEADHVLVTSVREARYRTGAMSSRIAQLAIVDILVVRLLQGDFTRASELLKRTFDAVETHRVG